MRQWKRLMLGGALILGVVLAAAMVLALVLPAPAAAAPAALDAYDITWDVVASGGATMSSSSYTMMSTAGQPVAGGPASSAGYSLYSGYWYAFQGFVRQLFLPLVLRS